MRSARLGSEQENCSGKRDFARTSAGWLPFTRNAEMAFMSNDKQRLRYTSTGEETKLQTYLNRAFKGDSNINFPKSFTIIGTNVTLRPPSYVLTRGIDSTFHEKNGVGRIGAIDVILRYRQKNYVTEIKDLVPIGDSFWYATKALAYCEYYKWQTDDRSYRPAVLIPHNALRLEHQIVANNLDLKIFLFKKNGDDYTIKTIDDRPHWRQEI